MAGWLRRPRWSPYVVGAGIGILSWITFGFMDEALGASTSFVRVAGWIVGVFAPGHLDANPYYRKYLIEQPAFDWQVWMLVGLFLGALLASRLSGPIAPEYVPPVWRQRFGPRRAVRYVGAFVGGVLVLFSSRLAGGCTSGHGISGSLQLAVGSLVFFVCLFVFGVLTAFVVYGRKGREV